MSAIAPIVIKDGAATPVAHTFAPVRIDANEVAMYTDRVTGISVGFPVITTSNKKNANGTYKTRAKVLLPVLNVTSPNTSTGIQPQPSVAFNLQCDVEFSLPGASSLANRKDVFAFVASLFDPAQSTVIRDMVWNLDTTY